MLISLIFVTTHLTRESKMGFYYAVAKGRKPGIYQTWEKCKEQVDKFPGPIFKKFSTSLEAQEFIVSRVSSSSKKRERPSDEISPKPTKSSKSRKIGIRESAEAVENGSSASKKNKTSNNDDVFSMDPDGYVNIYTDGACSKNGFSGAKAGIGVYFGDDSPLNISAPVVGRATNNTAEIQAVTRAAETAKLAGMTNLRIHTDSEFLIKCVTRWMPGWKRRGWKTASGNAVVNKLDLLEMESALEPFKIQWNHVRGHRGIHGNEMADKLAREGAEMYVSRPCRT